MKLIGCGLAVLALASTGARAQRAGSDRVPKTVPQPAPSPTADATADPRLDAATGFGAAFGYAYGDAEAMRLPGPEPRRRGSIADGAPQTRAVGGGGTVTTTSTGVGVAPLVPTARSVGDDTVVTTTTSEFAEPAPPVRPAKRRRARR